MKLARSSSQPLILFFAVLAGVGALPGAGFADELDNQDNNVCWVGDADIWGDICWGSGGGSGNPTPCKKCQRCNCAVGFSTNCGSATCCSVDSPNCGTSAFCPYLENVWRQQCFVINGPRGKECRSSGSYCY